MTKSAGVADANDPSVLHNAIALAENIRAVAGEIESGRRLPETLVRELKEAGIFGMAMPRSSGGPELDPLTQFRVFETLAMADGSVGWCAMINCDGGYVTAFLEKDVGRAMYPDIGVSTAAAVTPTGQAISVAGGYRVTGHFPFVSGCQHSEWIWLGCLVVQDGLIDGTEPTPARTARFQTAATHVIGTCVDVVRLVCKAAGGSAVYQKGPFDRCLRDILTMNQHVLATLRSYEKAGRLLLGLEPLKPSL